MEKEEGLSSWLRTSEHTEYSFEKMGGDYGIF